MRMRANWALCVAALLATPAPALEPPATAEETVSVQIAFSPGEEAARLIVQAVDGARRQVLVQAFSFTHREIAQALIAARGRGIDVRVIADAEQARLLANSVVADLAAAGVPVFLDDEHAAAHSKVMIIDAADASAVVITGSYNFTFAAQYRNAENLLLLRGGPRTTRAYVDNWRQHRAHSRAYK
jgi:phosphatidylserine/phosphatidylglycerophosphate/cardiolipin synthase-like enzyme